MCDNHQCNIIHRNIRLHIASKTDTHKITQAWFTVVVCNLNDGVDMYQGRATRLASSNLMAQHTQLIELAS